MAFAFHGYCVNLREGGHLYELRLYADGDGGGHVARVVVELGEVADLQPLPLRGDARQQQRRVHQRLQQPQQPRPGP